MDETVVSLDTMKSVYEMRATPEELDIIRSHLAAQEEGEEGAEEGAGAEEEEEATGAANIDNGTGAGAGAGAGAVAGADSTAGDGAGASNTRRAAIPLAATDQFIFRLTTIHKFEQRMVCWIFRASFEEKVLDIMSVLEILACTVRLLHHGFCRCAGMHDPPSAP
jgi:hypothetical protein